MNEFEVKDICRKYVIHKIRGTNFSSEGTL